MDIKKLIGEMSLKEKVGQLMQLHGNFFLAQTAAELTGPASRLNISPDDAYYAGSVLGFNGAEEMMQIQDTVMKKQPHHIPVLFMYDVIHGYKTVYPIPLAIACSFDDALAEKCAAMAAKEAAVSGVNVTFSPMVDIARDARWGRVMEGAGEDVTLGCRMANAAVRGYQGDMGKYNIAACVKHFAAYGATEDGRDYNSVDMSERTMRQTYLRPYHAATDAKVRMLMTSFNTIAGLPCAGNKRLVTDVLRGEWGFDGVVISDYNAYREMIRHGAASDYADAAAKATNAGGDIEMMSATLYLSAEKLINDGRITEKQIDDAVYRVLKLKDELGLFDNPYRTADTSAEKEINLCRAHRDTARDAARKCAVLLKNNGVLPFSKNVGRVALIGPFADTGEIIGSWACHGSPNDTVTVAAGIRSLLPDAAVDVIPAVSWDIYADDITGIPNAVKAAKKADAVVLCLGEHQSMSGEGNSRATLTLSRAQTELARAITAANRNTAVVVFGGRPLELTSIEPFSGAIMMMWQPGTEGGSACADLLFGNAEPEGRLAMSFPWCVGQMPIYYSKLPTARPVPNSKIITENTYCSRYIDAPVAPLYPFGYGLGYTTFEYSAPTVSKTQLKSNDALTVSVTVTNTGNRPGTDTVQLYIRDKTGSLSRPVKELKDYKKVALSPNESKNVTFTVTENDLRYYTARDVYESEKGEFEIMTGPDSDNIQTVAFELI
ncbi:MAG: glycoside hydrolase family 3 C-terminal domain-containing protein [Clostridia bacterium]|nr:glycoside hydrolase family 3 C-terminal domain-containing protein [Clostridia bacterium]